MKDDDADGLVYDEDEPLPTTGASLVCLVLVVAVIVTWLSAILAIAKAVQWLVK